MSTKVTQKQNTKVAFIHSIKTKIVLLVIAMIALTALMNIFMSVPQMKKDVNRITKNYMKDMAILAGNNIDAEMGYMGAEQILTPEELAKSVADIKVSGMESSMPMWYRQTESCCITPRRIRSDSQWKTLQ